jgi:hypothetical protein
MRIPPDPALHQSDRNLRPLSLLTLHFEPLDLHCERLRLYFSPVKLPNFDCNADPDSVFHSNAVADPASKNKSATLVGWTIYLPLTPNPLKLELCVSGYRGEPEPGVQHGGGPRPLPRHSPLRHRPRTGPFHSVQR